MQKVKNKIRIKIFKFFYKKRKNNSTKEYENSKLMARELVENRLQYYNQLYGFLYNRVVIKNHCSKWGSCSSKKNLNFNYRIIFLPPDLADYLIVHELCHLKEMNHSKCFWILVKKTFPDYKEKRKNLNKFVF